MRVLIYSSKPYEQTFFDRFNESHQLNLVYLAAHLDQETAALARPGDVVCAFVNDDLSQPVLERLHEAGVKHIALRCAGYNQVHLPTAQRLGMRVARVPAYSPHAVAEHTLALILALNRRISRAANRVREMNFSLNGLLGFDLHGRVAGVVGAGKIGACVARILHGFGCQVLVFDPQPQERLSYAAYVPLEQLFAESDIVTLHCPLTPITHHLIDHQAFALMKDGVMLINTSRGGLVDTRAAINALKSRKLGYLGLDVYEEEADLFFEDLSDKPIQDDVFARLLTFPNVLITSHQGFFTEDALTNIIQTTLDNVIGFQESTVSEENLVC